MTDTQKKILSSAISLFQKNGYSKTTVTSICRDCGITKATFYAYFSNKDDLIYAYFEERGEQLTDLLPHILEIPSTKEQIWSMYEYHIEGLMQLRPDTCKEFFLSDIQKGMLYFSPRKAIEISTSRDTQSKITSSLIRKAQATGEMRGLDADVLSQTFVKVILITALDWSSNQNAYDLKEELRQSFDALF